MNTLGYCTENCDKQATRRAQNRRSAEETSARCSTILSCLLEARPKSLRRGVHRKRGRHHQRYFFSFRRRGRALLLNPITRTWPRKTKTSLLDFKWLRRTSHGASRFVIYCEPGPANSRCAVSRRRSDARLMAIHVRHATSVSTRPTPSSEKSTRHKHKSIQ